MFSPAVLEWWWSTLQTQNPENTMESIKEDLSELSGPDAGKHFRTPEKR